jgi:hypothetical protein
MNAWTDATLLKGSRVVCSFAACGSRVKEAREGKLLRRRSSLSTTDRVRPTANRLTRETVAKQIGP